MCLIHEHRFVRSKVWILYAPSGPPDCLQITGLQPRWESVCFYYNGSVDRAPYFVYLHRCVELHNLILNLYKLHFSLDGVKLQLPGCQLTNNQWLQLINNLSTIDYLLTQEVNSFTRKLRFTPSKNCIIDFTNWFRLQSTVQVIVNVRR